MATDRQTGGRRDVRVAAGVISYILVSAIIAVAAAANLASEDYTIFMAYTSVFGVLLLGPSSALEQHSTLVTLAQGTSLIRTLRRLMPSAVGLAVGVSAIILIPIQEWQSRAFGGRKELIQLVMLTAIPILFFSSTARGRANGMSNLAAVGNAHFIYAGTTLLVSAGAWAIGIDLLSAVLIGQLVGWVTPGAYLASIARRESGGRPIAMRPSGLTAQSVLLVIVNLLLLANLLASQFIYRLHATDIGVEKAAESQLVLSISFVACAVALGLTPTLIQRARQSGFREFLSQPVSLIVLAVGVGAPSGAVLMGGYAVRILRGRTSELSYAEVIAMALSAMSLALAILLAAVLVARAKLLPVALAWAGTLAGVVATTHFFAGETHAQLPFSLALGFGLAPVLMVLALVVETRDDV